MAEPIWKTASCTCSFALVHGMNDGALGSFWLSSYLQELVTRARQRRDQHPQASPVPADLIGAVRADRGQVRLSLIPSAVVAAYSQLRGCSWDWAPVPGRLVTWMCSAMHEALYHQHALRMSCVRLYF